MSPNDEPISNPSSDQSEDGAPLRYLNIREAHALSEWVLILQDLNHSKQCVAQYKYLMEAETATVENQTTSISLFRDGIITLVSCFDVSGPEKLDIKTIFSSASGGEEYLNWLLSLRDTWIAHRHGPSRQAVVGLVTHPDTGEYIGVGWFSQNYAGISAEQTADLLRFIDRCISYSNYMVEELKKSVEIYAKNMRPEARLKLRSARTIVPDNEFLRMGRKKFRGIKHPPKPAKKRQ